MTNLPIRLAIAATAAAALTGCNLTGALDPPAAFPTGVAASKGPAFTPDSPAGLGVAPDPDVTKLTKLVATRDAAGSFGTARSDPFALTSAERAFETVQTGERLFSGGSGFSVQLTPKPVVEEDVTPLDPPPYRRLSGIVVGDSILAILEEAGREPLIVMPGMQLPNSEWRVVSIDRDKATLKRNGKARPSIDIVKLETPRFGATNQGAAGGFPGAPGGPPGGFPGGPGGFPGGGRGGRGGAVGD